MLRSLFNFYPFWCRLMSSLNSAKIRQRLVEKEVGHSFLRTQTHLFTSGGARTSPPPLRSVFCVSAAVSGESSFFTADNGWPSGTRQLRPRTRVYIHTRTHAGRQRCFPHLVDWIYDCGSPLPVSKDCLRANLSHQTPTGDGGGCGRRPVLNWNKFRFTVAVYISC